MVVCSPPSHDCRASSVRWQTSPSMIVIEKHHICTRLGWGWAPLNHMSWQCSWWLWRVKQWCVAERLEEGALERSSSVPVPVTLSDWPLLLYLGCHAQFRIWLLRRSDHVGCLAPASFELRCLVPVSNLLGNFPGGLLPSWLVTWAILLQFCSCDLLWT